MMIERDLRLVEETGGRYHIAHVSTAESVHAIREAKKRGLKITCDTAPPYFSLTENDVGDYRTFAKLSPPLRSETDRRAIVDGLADGTIDAIASDHLPHDQDSKRIPFAQAEFGAVGLETMLPLALELYHNKKITLVELFKRLSLNPAKILGIEGGSLKKGKAADFILVDLDTPWIINKDHLKSKSRNTPFDERPVTGKIMRTIINGKTVFEFKS
jgi:dihydroorotase